MSFTMRGAPDKVPKISESSKMWPSTVKSVGSLTSCTLSQGKSVSGSSFGPI